jgi:hypothetical protein
MGCPLKLIGYWIRDLRDDQFPAPQELPVVDDVELRRKVVEYLARGVQVRQYRGSSFCRFHCGASYLGGSELSDGEWAWPDGLSHYVESHGVALPEEFIATVVRNGCPPAAVDKSAEPSLDFWIEWCRARRNKEFLRAKQAELALARERINLERLQLASRRAALEGVSTRRCAFTACPRPALKIGVFCGWHCEETGGGFDGIEIRNTRAKSLLLRWWASQA